MNAVSCEGRSSNIISFFLIIILALCTPGISSAQWSISTDPQNPDGEATQVAFTSNEEGYTLEIYKDANSTIRSRFILKDGMLKFHEKSCPTYQIDTRITNNNSNDGAPCLLNDQWVEYIVGKIQNNEVVSPLLRALMNGNTLSFRFRLANGDYRETKFSLRGSNASMTSAFGQQLNVRTR